jgi:hypothetical protein
MNEQATGTRECPFCKEEVKADAVRCKHCQSSIPRAEPGHRGTCPYCKESIDPEAVRCKHCQADLAPAASCSCGQEGAARRRAISHQAVAPIAGGRRKVMPRRAEGTRPLLRSAPEGCNDYEVDEDGTVWCFIEDSEHYCIYEQC